MSDSGADEAEIRDLLATYALTLDVDDLDGCLDLFTDEGEFVVYGKTLVRERIRTMFTRAPRGMHLAGAASIQIEGHNAVARSQVLFVDSATHSIRPALYDDDLSKVDGRWRFVRRRCQFLTPDGLADAPAEPSR